jgi:hypothetical protein
VPLPIFGRLNEHRHAEEPSLYSLLLRLASFFKKLASIICSTANEGGLIFGASAFLGLISEQTKLSDKCYTTILNTKNAERVSKFIIQLVTHIQKST